MSVVVYNGVQLPYSDCTQFSQEAVYDDQGGTDRIRTKFDIQVQCLLSYEYLIQLEPLLVGVGGPLTRNPALITRAIRAKLLRPRRELLFLFNGINLIPKKQDSIDGNVDADNGPKPTHCSIVEITNSTYVLSFGIIASYWENTELDLGAGEENNRVANLQGNIVLSNRWSETVSIDDCGFSRLSRDGQYTIRSDNAAGAWADEVRSGMAVTSIPAGFLRESSQFSVSPDGLSLRYSIVDKEFFRSPPSPSFKANGSYTESTVPNQGIAAAWRWGEVRASVKGSKDTPQADLVVTAIRVGLHKLSLRILAGRFDDPAVLIHSAHVTHDMYEENSVEFRMKMMLGASANRTTDTPLPFDLDVGVLGDTAYVPPYLDRGSASILLQAAAYWNPNDATVESLRGGNRGTIDNPSTLADPSFDEDGVDIAVPIEGLKVNFPGRVPGEAGLVPEE